LVYLGFELKRCKYDRLFVAKSLHPQKIDGHIAKRSRHRVAQVVVADGRDDTSGSIGGRGDDAAPGAVLFVDGALSDDVVGLGFVPEVDGGERIHCV